MAEVDEEMSVRDRDKDDINERRKVRQSQPPEKFMKYQVD